MLKFLPGVATGYINTFDKNAQWPSLTVEAFQRRRSVTTTKLPKRIPEGNPMGNLDFPDLVVDYSKPYNFFLLGLTVSQTIIRTAALGSTVVAAYGAWRMFNRGN